MMLNLHTNYRRYAWSAKLPLSILTDFEELVVYESRTLPKKNDSTGTGRILYITYRDYVDKWDEIYSIFSKNAVFKGAFNQYADGTKQKHGTEEIDNVFLSEIEGWRELFAKNIALRNNELTVDELNYSVQQIINRIIFLRIAKDRGIEKYGKLQTILEEGEVASKFTEICKEADEKYNSGLFHFNNVDGRNTAPDELTPTVKIDNGVFKTIIKGLYYPEDPLFIIETRVFTFALVNTKSDNHDEWKLSFPVKWVIVIYNWFSLIQILLLIQFPLSFFKTPNERV